MVIFDAWSTLSPDCHEALLLIPEVSTQMSRPVSATKAALLDSLYHVTLFRVLYGLLVPGIFLTFKL